MCKKALGACLALCLVVLSLAPVFAAEDCRCENLPLIVVSGMNTYPMVQDKGTAAEKEVFPPQLDVAKIVATAVQAIAAGLWSQDWDAFVDVLVPLLQEILDPIACDENGDFRNDIQVEQFPQSMAHYLDAEMLQGESNEFALLRAGVARYGADHTYFYNYAWPTDPMDNAKELRTLVETAKRESGHDQVILAPCSFGGAQVMAYLAQYGSDDIACISFLSTVVYGSLLATDVLQQRVTVEPAALMTFLGGNELMDGILQGLNALGLLDLLQQQLDDIILQIKDRLYAEALVDIFGTMPGLWALVQPDEYAAAKDVMLDSVKHANLIARADQYQTQVAGKRDALLRAAQENGTKIIVFSHYGSAPIPIYPQAVAQNDGIVELYCTSAGATAAAIDETLGEGYTQKNASCGHNHLSADGIIDASTCVFPEYTWFFRGTRHVGVVYGGEQADFLFQLYAYDGQPTVNSPGLLPQFLQEDDVLTLSPLGEVIPQQPAEEDTTPSSTQPTSQPAAAETSTATTQAAGQAEGVTQTVSIPETGRRIGHYPAVILALGLLSGAALRSKRRRGIARASQ